MTNKSEPEPKEGATALPLPKNGKREVEEDEDEEQLNTKKQKIDEVSEERKIEKDKEVATASPLPKNGKREVEEDEDEKQVNTKKQKIDEVSEEQKSEKDKEEMHIAEGGGGGSEESDEQAQKKKMEISMNAESNAEKPDLETVTKDTSRDADNSDDGGGGGGDTEKQHMVKKPVKNSEVSEDIEEAIEDKASETPQESPKSPATPKEKNAASKTIYVRNLSFNVEQADMENLFNDCGEIVEIRLHTDREGRFRGFGHVEFAAAEAAQKALELDNTELLRRPIRVGIAPERGEYMSNPNRSNSSNSFQKGERFQSLTVFVKGFDTSLGHEEIKASLEEHFSSCGEITRISIPEFRDSGAVKGFAHLEFKDVDGLKKALQLDQTKLGSYALAVEKAKPQRDNQGVGGDYRYGRRDGGGHDNQGVGGDRGGSDYGCGRRDGGGRDNQGVGGDRGGADYRYGRRDGGGHGGRPGRDRSGGGGRHWTPYKSSPDEGKGRMTTFADDYCRRIRF